MTFTEHEISIILKGLAKLPYEESSALINRIVNDQANQKIREEGMCYEN